jgi:hypothetical protein
VTAGMGDVEVVAQEAVTVRPGDTLIVRVRPDIDPEQVHGLRAALMDRLPDIAVLIVACEQLAAAKR